MADTNMVQLLDMLRNCDADADVDFLREAVGWLAEQLMELEVSAKIGASRYERTKERSNRRNGYRQRDWDTRVGTLPIRIPKLREGSYFPALLEPRRRAERALLSVVQEAYTLGVSTRKVDDLVKALGMDGISSSQVSRICAELDEKAEAFRNRPLTGEYPYVWLDATFAHVRQDGKVTNQALVVAVGVNHKGTREVLGLDVGPTESAAFWQAFLRSLVERGLSGVKLVISDAHLGLVEAIAGILHGASWQRCRVHFMRNILCLVPRAAQSMVSAAVRTIFAQPDQDKARATLHQVAQSLSRGYPKVSALLLEAEEQVLTYMGFPPEHWRQIHSTNTLERLNREIKRRTDVVGIFPNPGSLLRLASALLEETHEEWMVCRRYFSQASMQLLLRKGKDPLAALHADNLEAAA